MPLTVHQLENTRRAAALYRSHSQLAPSTTFMSWLTKLLDEMPELSYATRQFPTPVS